MSSLFVALFLCGTWRSTLGCDLVGLNLCTWKFALNVTDRTADGIPTIPPAKEAKQMCRYRPHLLSCFQPKLHGCSSNIVYMSTIAPTRGTLKFMCDGDLEAYLSHDSCWIQPEVKNMTTGCYLDYISSIQLLLSSPHLLSEPESLVAEKICRMSNRSRICMYDAVKTKCSDTAAAIVDELMKNVFGEMTSYFNCQNTTEVTNDGSQGAIKSNVE